MVPLLAGVTVLRSPYVAGPPSGSQLLHSDWEDVSQLKLFVHCSDVTSRKGPLTALRATASARVKQALRYRYGAAGSAEATTRCSRSWSRDELRAFEGPAGTAVFSRHGDRARGTPVGRPLAVPTWCDYQNGICHGRRTRSKLPSRAI